MTTRLSSHLVTLLALLNVLCSQGSGLPALGTYSNLRLGNTASLDGQNEDDPSELRMKQDSDIYPGGLNANDKLYYQLLQGVPRAARHADGLFTSGYSKLLGQQSARKYLESLMGKRVSTLDEQEPVKRHSDALFTDRYSRIRKQMALKKYLNGLVAGKRSQELSPADLPDTAQYDENFENLAVDDLLNHLPSLSR